MKDLKSHQISRYNSTAKEHRQNRDLSPLSHLRAKKDILNDLLQSLKRRIKPIKVLDIGCNTGELLGALESEGVTKYGLDISPECIRLARIRYGIDGQIGDASEPLPYSDGMFNVVIASEIIEHLLDTDSFLAEIFRVLKPGGYVCVTSPNINSLRNRLYVLFGKYPTSCEYRLAPTSAGHIRVYNKKTLCEQLRTINFIIKNSYCTKVLPAAWSRNNLVYWLSSRIAGRLFPTLGADIVVIAQKSGNKPK